MKSVFAVWTQPEMFTQGNQGVNRSFPMFLKTEHADEAIKIIKDVPGVVAVGILGPEKPDEKKPGSMAQLPGVEDDYADRDEFLCETPVRIIISAALGTLLEDVFEDVRNALEAYIVAMKIPHDPTEVILMEAAQQRRRVREDRKKRSTVNSSTPRPPVTDRRQRLARR